MAAKKSDETAPPPPVAVESVEKTRTINKYALACSIMASMTSIVLGYDGGVMSGATIYLKEDLKISDVQIEVLVGVFNIYSLLGAAMAGRTSDWIGRRYTMVLAGGIFFVGAILMGFATNYSFLMVGRFVAGIGMGYSLMIAPVYTAEVAPVSSRGFLTSFPEVFINFGVLLGYVSNLALSKLPINLNWRIMLGLGAIPPIFIILGVLVMPESPRWLVMQGRLGEARRVLDKTSESLEESRLRLADIMEVVGIPDEFNQNDVVPVPNHDRGGTGIWKELFLHPTLPVRHILLAALGIHFFQQASGVDVVVLYSPRIYEKAGITNNTHKLLATIAVGFTKTSFILVATFMLDKIGRRVLLLSSAGGMAFSLMGLAIGLTFINHHHDHDNMLTCAIVLCITCTLSSVAFFSIGMGPIAWVYSSEVFPLRLRAQGCSMGVAINRVTSGIVLISFISLYEKITIGGAFFMYTGIVVVAWIFFYTLLPETKGRGLEEMEVLFGTFFRWRSTSKDLKNRDGVMSRNSRSDDGD